MPYEPAIMILAGVAVAGLTVWTVETLAEQRSARDRKLDAIDQTLRQLVATMADATATLAGPGATGPGRFDADAYPRAEARLVGDIEALREFYVVLAELHRRVPGTGVRPSDLQKAAAAIHRIRSALVAQEKLVLRRRPLRALTRVEVQDLGALYQAVMDAMRLHGLAQVGGAQQEAPDR